ncbi:hypothetical protein PMIN01_00894 [Paraphaeosphaeria minitans]|uniref:Uncharacterized protein n=1 Tax=Paraphaeosphaeria minitans TaxID=565426 RepID=A0A9P6KWF2_9PLEO|nr:hypothetical protein PMIN01_00894 [Paraphaeosphaeria minitans]
MTRNGTLGSDSEWQLIKDEARLSRRRRMMYLGGHRLGQHVFAYFQRAVPQSRQLVIGVLGCREPRCESAFWHEAWGEHVGSLCAGAVTSECVAWGRARAWRRTRGWGGAGPGMEQAQEQTQEQEQESEQEQVTRPPWTCWRRRVDSMASVDWLEA